MRRSTVTWFYILAFGIAWLGWVPLALGSYGMSPFGNPHFQVLLIFPATGPALAAFIVTRMTHGKTGVRDLLKALIQWRVDLVWYIVAVFSPIVLFAAGKAITKLLNLSVAPTGPKGDLFSVAVSVFAVSLLPNICEEIGWRGFALPRLQRRYNALLATLIVGVLWGLWHLPLFFSVGNPMSEDPLPHFIFIVAGAFIYTWLYNSAKGSILPVALFHVALNTFGATIPGVSITVMAIVFCLVAVALVATFGRTGLSRQERASEG